MQRRTLFRVLVALPAVLPSLALAMPQDRRARPILIQSAPVAGFQFHDGPKAWKRIRVRDGLYLRRERRNPHDTRAVAVWWKNRKLGYLPRRENAAIAQMLDRGQPLIARIERLTVSDNPWERVQFSVSIP